MTFLSRRKRQTIHRASPAKWAATIISAALVWSGCWAGAHGQSPYTIETGNQVVSPNFVPVGQRPASAVVPAAFTQPFPPQPQQVPVPGRPRMPSTDEAGEYYVRTELPGPQRMFIRESESQFYNRIREDVKRQSGSGPAIFPEEPIVSKESTSVVLYPRLDPISKMPFAPASEIVEPCYVCHGRLLFEQPNFERLGYNFGIATTGMELGTFLYDWALLPYHMCSNLKVRGECSAGKCLPGDQAPFTVPIERFSVTGIIGEAGVIIGGMYLFP